MLVGKRPELFLQRGPRARRRRRAVVPVGDVEQRHGGEGRRKESDVGLRQDSERGGGPLRRFQKELPGHPRHAAHTGGPAVTPPTRAEIASVARYVRNTGSAWADCASRWATRSSSLSRRVFSCLRMTSVS